MQLLKNEKSCENRIRIDSINSDYIITLLQSIINIYIESLGYYLTVNKDIDLPIQCIEYLIILTGK